jgi:superfamily I DNA and/or RNA helicase
MFRGDLRAWCNDRIGTVHTFQGKEEQAVIFVLGADHQTEGSASWAAKKPNLLNVAVTRAKRRLYIVGDRSLYRKLPYFSHAAAELRRVLPSEFLYRPAQDLSEQI